MQKLRSTLQPGWQSDMMLSLYVKKGLFQDNLTQMVKQTANQKGGPGGKKDSSPLFFF